MKLVKTKEELEAAIKSGERSIRLEGEIALKVIMSKKRAKTAKRVGVGVGIGGVLAGIALAPLTGGASLLGSAAAATASGLTIGAITITAAELALILGFTLGMTALLKNYDKIKVGKDWVTIEKTK